MNQFLLFEEIILTQRKMLGPYFCIDVYIFKKAMAPWLIKIENSKLIKKCFYTKYK